MKKLFALVLAVVMICAMSTSAFAAYDIGGTDGVTSFDDNVGTSNLDIKASAGNIEHRYAVDIEYDALTINVVEGGKLIWNVNELKYETDTDGEIPADKTFNAKITNYSDLPVYLTVKVVDTNAEDGAIVKAYKNDTNDLLGETAIKIGDATGGTAIEYDFDVQVKADTANSKDWDFVANYYADYFTTNNATTATMATMTLTVSMTE